MVAGTLLSDFNSIVNHLNTGKADGDYYVSNKGVMNYLRVSGSAFLDKDFVLIGFSGAVVNKKSRYEPFFSFMGISRELEIPLISFSDPSLMLDDKLNLGWYLGSKFNPNYPNDVASCLDHIVATTGKKMILAGGSGGGFAALNIANKMRFKESVFAMVWNPQIVVERYNVDAVNLYFKVCWNERYDARETSVKFRGARSLIMMDGLDHAHLRLHLREYLNGQKLVRKSGSYYFYGRTSVLLGGWGAGHTQPPKDLIINQIKEIVQNWGQSYADYNSKKEIVDFSKCSNSFYTSIHGCFNVSLDSGELEVSSRINERYIGYQIKYKLFDARGVVVFKSSWLKNKHGCTAYAKLRDEEVADLSDWMAGVVLEDFHGSSLEFFFPVELSSPVDKKIAAREEMKRC